MRKGLAIAALLLFVGVADAKHDYPLTFSVDKQENIEAQHGSLHFGWVGNSGGGGFGHKVTKHIYAVGSDNNIYDLIPKDQRDLILPGSYPARLEKRDVVMEIPNNGKNGTREVKFLVAGVEPLKQSANQTNPDNH